jgi:O-antigen ligase
VAAGTAAIVTAANASQGGYFSQSWGWIALAFLVPTTVALIVGAESSPGRLRRLYALFMASLAAWIAGSTLWSLSTPGSIREFERMVVYVAVALAVTFLFRSTDRPALLAGILIGVTLVCAYSLGTRLFPDRLVTHDDPYFENRLGQPLGYPNALGALAALGILVALGFVAHSRRLTSAAVAAALIPLQSAVLYFTFSRGAWFSLAVSVVVAIAIDPRWLASAWTVLLTAVPALAGIAVASGQETLTTSDVVGAAAAPQGHRVAAILVTLSAGSALVAAFARISSRRVHVPRTASRAIGIGIVGAAAVFVVAVVMSSGGPSGTVSRVKGGFETLPVSSVDLNSLLFSIYGTGRGEIWPVAIDQFRSAPIVGEGAGSFEYAWYQRRDDLRTIRDAHSLYLETMGELGLVGLSLLAATLLVPFVAAIRSRRRRFVPFALAAYISWALACTSDWHWEMTGLTVTALLAGSVALLGFDKPGRPSGLSTDRRVALVASVGLSTFAIVSLVGNQALFASKEEVARGEWTSAQSDARRARALLPWSYEPYLVLGDAAARLGDRSATIEAYRSAVAKDPRNWGAWLRLAQVERGAARRAAYAKVHELNPLQEDLPGESSRP